MYIITKAAVMHMQMPALTLCQCAPLGWIDFPCGKHQPVECQAAMQLALMSTAELSKPRVIGISLSRTSCFTLSEAAYPTLDSHSGTDHVFNRLLALETSSKNITVGNLGTVMGV
eukprot:2924974-Amphidinium_carterae.1